MDTLVIGLWVALDPFERHLYNLVRVVSSLDRSVVYQPQVYFRFVLINHYVALMFDSFIGRSVSLQQVVHVAGNPLRQKGIAASCWCLHGLGNEVLMTILEQFLS